MYDGMRATGWSGSQLIKGIARVPLFSSIQVGPSHDKSAKGTISILYRMALWFFLLAAILDDGKASASAPSSAHYDRGGHFRELRDLLRVSGSSQPWIENEEPEQNYLIPSNSLEVILNLFLAILMSNFDEQRSKLHAALASKRTLLRV